MQSGYLDLCLKVENIEKSLAFYKVLGFRESVGSIEDGFLYISNGIATIGLFEKYIAKTLLNFRGGDVYKIEEELEKHGFSMKEKAVKEDDGSDSAYIEDPDGNLIYFNTCQNDIKVLEELKGKA